MQNVDVKGIVPLSFIITETNKNLNYFFIDRVFLLVAVKCEDN